MRRLKPRGLGAEPTAAELYMVAADAWEEAQGRTYQDGRKLRREAKKLVADARELDPSMSVPRALQELVPFDEDEVRIDMAFAIPGFDPLNYDPDDIDVDATTVGDEDAFEVKVARISFVVMRSAWSAEKGAFELVKQDLENKPEIFNAGFLEQYVDQQALKKYVYDFRMEDDYVDELASRDPRQFWRLAKQFGIEPEESDDEDANEPDPDDYTETVKEAYALDAASDPMAVFHDLYGNEATAEAIKAVGIDIEAAARNAVREDGWSHFLTYDGNSETTNAGFVYWRAD